MDNKLGIQIYRKTNPISAFILLSDVWDGLTDRCNPAIALPRPEDSLGAQAISQLAGKLAFDRQLLIQ